MGLTPNQIELHGHRVSYRHGGSGPALLLLHGVTNSSATWERVAPGLAEHFTLIAPDLLGHGESATPRGDYSLGAHASGARDVMTALGIERATIVGHSLGGGIAMQFAYQFPERCERLVLVSSGGLGREVHLLLRAATLPGADYVLPALTSAGLVGIGRRVGGLLRRVRITPGEDMQVLAEGFASLDNAGSRQAFLHTVRAVIEPGGQRVSANDRLAPGRAAPVDDRVGREGLDHPGRARHRGPRGDAREPLRGLPRRRPHAPQRRPGALRLTPGRLLRDDRARQADRRSLGYGDPITALNVALGRMTAVALSRSTQ